MRTNLHEEFSLSESTNSFAPFAIPLIVERIFQNKASWVNHFCFKLSWLIFSSLKVICECLGYELSSVRSDKPLFENALYHGHVRKRPALTPYKPSKRQCPDYPSSPLSEAFTRLRNGWELTCADHQGQRAQCQSSREVNITAEGSVLPQGIPGHLSQILLVFFIN